MSKVDLNKLFTKKLRGLKAYEVKNIDCVIKLHANENPYPPPADLMDLFRKTLDDFRLNRYPDPDCLELKETVSERLNVPVESLVIGNGSDELIQLIQQVFCDPVDTIAFPDPTFAMYAILAEGQGISPATIPLDERWDFKAEQFEEAIQNRNARVLFISYPNNPTGNCFSDNEILKLIETFPGIVVVDEAYYDFSKKTFAAELNKHNNLIIIRSFSKIGLAGLRVGYAIAHPEIIRQINKVRLPYNSNTVSQVLTTQLLKNFSIIQNQIDTIVQERNRLFEALSKIESLTAFPTDSNFILFRVDNEGEAFFNKLIENGILVRYLGSHPKLENCLRVTVGTPRENHQFLEKATSIMCSTTA